MTQDNIANEPTSISSDNLLLTAAWPLLNTIVQIRLAATHDDPLALRLQLIEEMHRYEQRCKTSNIPFDMMIAARYCLCSALDEAAAQTPWGSRGIWSGNGLLVTFHNESWGGDKVFQLLARLSQAPHQHLWLLETIHYCLLLGYEGRYRTLDNGRSQRDGIRSRLFQLIEETRGRAPAMLSAEAQTLQRHADRWQPPVPLWVCLIVTTLIACLLYSTFNWRLSQRAASLLSDINQIPLPTQNDKNSSPPENHSPSLLTLATPLRDLIDAGNIAVIEDSNDSKVILAADRLFDASSVGLTASGQTLIYRIAAAMDNRGGTILVSAWSDRRALSDTPFANSYEYTLAQARSVSAALQQVMKPGKQRIRVEGRGDDSAADSDTRLPHALLKRRIEITLYPSPDNASGTESRRQP
ncbi:hypothetical protein BL250_10820 [Erwinia sp. OLTSP20]|nr:hypothetical protein BV501_10700 [Erwinia sp. OAMSP11]PIJ71408.1 hypothetical protein BK416_11695 [Erwinia sp. OLSSP12]PIJ80642.1 hypothetical protein BLD47_10590 [Erwinia sp. OLCASP19]PIJ82800.1 hypothetical protein BLD46_10480 [Erwinia sp. OLMTSP26]PIJ85486.1 hypothetical protein BLD49_10670 [Erwinia sp. OLMDSP33]PIJ92237.1 hypothetical protein BL250_10820 [Erwinia sp. OLTSP20]PIJ93306.1 hypothetical protein BL249_04775 [Erwinia sp. OLFS4]